MKRIIAGILVLCCVVCALPMVGCGSSDKSDKISIVTTIFPEYDWVKQIIGDDANNIELTLLLDTGVDLHNYQPTAEDIIKVSTCDMFIYVGGHSDSWVADVLKQAKNDKMVVINLMDVLGDAVKEEEVVEGMEHDHEHEDEHHEEHKHEKDEHVWLSLNNAVRVCKKIGEEIAKLDSENEAKYKKNLDAYCDRLKVLDDMYKETVSKANKDTLIFADRFPFRYLVDDYGLHYYAAFSGCSAESEASFEIVTYLAGKIDELGLTSVIVLEGSDNKIAKTVIDATDGKSAGVISMNSMQSVTYDDVKNGANYISIMESNLKALTSALN